MNASVARELQEVLRKTGLTISTAESIPAGRIAATIASVSGASAYLRGGVIAYHIDTKVGLLGVEREHAETCNCVSEKVARQMASGVRKVTQADIGLAATGYAGPWPEEGITQPQAWVAFDCLGQVQAAPISLPVDTPRQGVQQRVAEHVIQRLLAFFEELASGRSNLIDPEDPEFLTLWHKLQR